MVTTWVRTGLWVVLGLMLCRVGVHCASGDSSSVTLYGNNISAPVGSDLANAMLRTNGHFWLSLSALSGAFAGSSDIDTNYFGQAGAYALIYSPVITSADYSLGSQYGIGTAGAPIPDYNWSIGLAETANPGEKATSLWYDNTNLWNEYAQTQGRWIWVTDVIEGTAFCATNVAFVRLYGEAEVLTGLVLFAGDSGYVDNGLYGNIHFDIVDGQPAVIKAVTIPAGAAGQAIGKQASLPLAPNSLSSGPFLSSFSFTNVADGNWISCGLDLPFATGLRFLAQGTNLFTGVAFPSGVTNAFNVLSSNMDLGTFEAGANCTFTNLAPDGVAEFEVSWQRPLQVPGAVLGVPLRLSVGPTNADFDVEPLSAPGPQLLIEPVGCTKAAGSSVILSGAALSQSSVTYSWLRNGKPLDGAASAQLVLTNCQPAQSGGYQIVAADASGSITSAVAVVTIVPGALIPSTIDVQVLTQSNLLSLVVAVEPGRAYRVQASPDLATWSDATNFFSVSNSFEFLDPVITARFYRVVSP